MRRVSAFTFGGVRDLLVNEVWRVGVGADVTFYDKPASLDQVYGRRPASYRVFLRFRPGAK